MSGKLLLAAVLAVACPAATQVTIDARLRNPLSSDRAHPGDPFEAIVTASSRTDGREHLPPGTVIRGVVREATKVGLGLRRERANLRLAFREYVLPTGEVFPLMAVLGGVDNARESVTDTGQIRGILAADSTQTFVRGVWHRPGPGFLQRTAGGLTGASGSVWARMALGPIGGTAIFLVRSYMFKWPDPEIRLPAGADLRVTAQVPDDAPSFAPPAPAAVPDDLAVAMAASPVEVRRENGAEVLDIINMAFVGTEDQVREAFKAAGWYPAEPLTKRSFIRTYKAFTQLKSYPTAPVSALYYGGEKPGLVFQKALNSISRRHHIRLWQTGALADGSEVWLGAATHDIGIEFNKRKVTLDHVIDTNIDRERSRVISDLRFAGCTTEAGWVERSDLANTSDRTSAITDGRLAVLKLRDCASPVQTAARQPGVKHNVFARLIQRASLEARFYVLRGNVYYQGWRLLFRRGTPEVSGQTVD